MSNLLEIPSTNPVLASCNFNGTTNSNQGATYSQSSTTITVTLTNHGHLVGQKVNIDFTSGTAVDSTFVIASVPTANTFTVTAVAPLTTSGNCNLLRRTLTNGVNCHSITDMGSNNKYFCFSKGVGKSVYNVVPNFNFQAGVLAKITGFMFSTGTKSAVGCDIATYQIAGSTTSETDEGCSIIG